MSEHAGFYLTTCFSNLDELRPTIRLDDNSFETKLKAYCTRRHGINSVTNIMNVFNERKKSDAGYNDEELEAIYGIVNIKDSHFVRTTVDIKNERVITRDPFQNGDSSPKYRKWIAKMASIAKYYLMSTSTKQMYFGSDDMKAGDALTEQMKEQMQAMVEKLLINSGNTTNNNNHNSHNTINNTIHINNYGNENTDYLKGDYLNNLLQGAFTAIPKLIENIHFNPQHPENHNIKITNKKEPYVKIRKNDKWELQDKKETLETLVDDKYYILVDHYADMGEDKISEKTKTVMEQFHDSYIDNKDLQKDLQKKSEMIILNNS